MKTVAVFFGSRSAEHDVSIVTALASIIKPLELSKQYKVEAIYIAKDGSWHWGDKFKDISLYSAGNIDMVLQKDNPVQVSFDGGFSLIKQKSFGSKTHKVKIDIAIPATHGTNGEDGALMGLLEMANITYVGCGLESSVLAMNKVLAKQLAIQNNIFTPKFFYTNNAQSQSEQLKLYKLSKDLSLPLYVKPAHLGSSIGITKVDNYGDLANAIEVAAHYDSTVLVEESVQNCVEVTLPIMGNNKPTVGLLERPMVLDEDFFDFNTKYMQGGKKTKGAKSAQGYSELPAKLAKLVYDDAIKTGLNVYKALGCSGIARVDMLINQKNKKVYFNEINPLPGDLYRHNWRAAGISTVRLVTDLIDFAEQRFKEKSAQTTTFSTNYLKQF